MLCCTYWKKIHDTVQVTIIYTNGKYHIHSILFARIFEQNFLGQVSRYYVCTLEHKIMHLCKILFFECIIRGMSQKVYSTIRWFQKKNPKMVLGIYHKWSVTISLLRFKKMIAMVCVMI